MVLADLMKTAQLAMPKRFDSLVDHINTFLLKLGKDTMDSSEVITNSPNQSSVSSESQHSNISQAFSSALSEEREKDKRRLSLILHNIPEPNNESGEKRKQDDTDTAVVNIIDQHLGVPTSISNAARLGKKTSKVRLLRITVSSEHDKAIILRNSTKLRSIDGAEYLTKLFITPEMNRAERE